MKKLIMLTGPTCAGKTTVEKALNALGVPSIVSYTTRPQRTSEVNGRDYFFLTKNEVDALDKEGKLIEKIEFQGNFYGSTLSAVEAAFKDSDIAVIVVEPSGISKFTRYAENKSDLKILPIYLWADYKTIVERLIKRYLENRDHNDQLEQYYWSRLVEQYEAYHDWPSYTNWTESFQVNHRLVGCSPIHIAEDILELAKGK